MIMFRNPKKDYKLAESTPSIKYTQQKMFTAPKWETENNIAQKQEHAI